MTFPPTLNYFPRILCLDVWGRKSIVELKSKSYFNHDKLQSISVNGSFIIYILKMDVCRHVGEVSIVTICRQ